MTLTSSTGTDDDDDGFPPPPHAHAFHVNLPPHHFNPEDRVPYVTKFAQDKARQILELAQSIQLTESLFLVDAEDSDEENMQRRTEAHDAEGNGEEEDDAGMDVFDNEGDDDNDNSNEDGKGGTNKETLVSLMKKCSRLQSQLNALENLKHCGISDLDMARIVLHLLHLVTCTVTYDDEEEEELEDNDEEDCIANEEDAGIGVESAGTGATTTGLRRRRRRRGKAVLHYENMGYIYDSHVAGPIAIDDSLSVTSFDSTYRHHVDAKKVPDDPQLLEEELEQQFALPTPARETLLTVIVNILSNKGPLRSFSNSSIYPKHNNSDSSSSSSTYPARRFLMIFHWKAFLRMLLRTAPYLDEHKTGGPPTDSNSRQNNITKRTVQLIRDARHFFDQGIGCRPPPSSSAAEVAAAATTEEVMDKTAQEVWNMVRNDVLYHSHTHACYRGSILLYLFLPSSSSEQYYLQVLPLWMNAWTNIDRCPEYDFLWLALFCRARKHVSCGRYDWGPIRRRLLTSSQYWLQLPIGGAAMDKSFPRVANPRSRSCPARLKALAGASSSYEEGIDFVAKVAKLLITSLGAGGKGDESSTSSSANFSEGTRDVLRFFSFVTPYFNPSNLGSWTFTLGAFLHYFCYELACRVGTETGWLALSTSSPELAVAVKASLPGCYNHPPLAAQEKVALLDTLLPLCQQAMYSKNGHVGRAGEASMLYLVQMDPVRSAPPFMDFAMKALDISAVNLAHQAPTALSVLTRLVQPAVRSHPAIFFSRLPEILRLSLAGIDSNDRNKTMRTLILYRSLTSWIPVGGKPETWPSISIVGDGEHTRCGPIILSTDGTIRIGKDIYGMLAAGRNSSEYCAALEQLSPSSMLKQGVEDEHNRSVIQEDADMHRLLLEEASSALTDWSLEFLDRIYGLLRSTGEREKAGKTSSGVANRHTSADVNQARNSSRVLKECLQQVFAAMDDTVHALAVRSVARFIEEETLPAAAKDVSLLCQAAAAARLKAPNKNGQDLEQNHSLGLDVLMPVLTDDLSHHSTKTVIYRLRCLAGAVRYAGRSVIKHAGAICGAIEFALKSNTCNSSSMVSTKACAPSDDRHLFKTGCKLLRHVLSTLSESYPLSSNCIPSIFTNPNSTMGMTFGRSAQLNSSGITWYVPDCQCIDLAAKLMQKHVVSRLEAVSRDMRDDNMTDDSRDGGHRSRMLNFLEVQELRKCLRVIRYCLRGGAGILLDRDDEQQEGDNTEEERGALKGRVNDDDDMVNDDAASVSSKSSGVKKVPYEQACHGLLSCASVATREALFEMRGRLCSFLIVLQSAIASETLYPDAIQEFDDSSTYKKNLSILSADPKVCKETCNIALLLLTRRGASFRTQEARTIWKAQKQLAADFLLTAAVDHMVECLQYAGLYNGSRNDSITIRYKDGEDAGKTIPRRLLVARVKLFHDSLQRQASMEVPKRLRWSEKKGNLRRDVVFSGSQLTLQGMLTKLEGTLAPLSTSSPYLVPCRPLDAYEGIVDGLFALSCHSNTQVRGSAVSVIDYATTRFGWLVAPRIPRLLSAIGLTDGKQNGKFGLPALQLLTNKVNQQGKHKRLAEAIKGVCSILALPRCMKHVLASQKLRLVFEETICGTDRLINLVPSEETQKTVIYFQNVFSPFRSRFYSLPRASVFQQKCHNKGLKYALDILSEDGNSSSTAADDGTKNATTVEVVDESTENKAAHWRKLLLAAWFLLTLLDSRDVNENHNESNTIEEEGMELEPAPSSAKSKQQGQTDAATVSPASSLVTRAWLICFRILETESGQPLQRVALGLFGKLLMLMEGDNHIRSSANFALLKSRCQHESFCRVLGQALVFDHREDSRVGGGHGAQWSAGVEDVLREASRNVAGRSLFPFQRTSQSLATFKVSHAQLVELVLRRLDQVDPSSVTRTAAATHLLAFAKEMAAAPPSEDQLNQQVTSAEIFAGVCGAYLRSTTDNVSKGNSAEMKQDCWSATFFPFLEDVMGKIPFALSSAYFDAIRYALQFCSPKSFYPLTARLADKIRSTLWQPASVAVKDMNELKAISVEATSTASTKDASPSTGTEGFTAQSKWLYLFSAVLIEMDESVVDGMMERYGWYSNSLTAKAANKLARADGEKAKDASEAGKELEQSWLLVTTDLLPTLTNAVGHPFDSCRDHIARVLFRICYCHRKRERIISAARNNLTIAEVHEADGYANNDPGKQIVSKLAALKKAGDASQNHNWTFEGRYNALSTTRRFMSYSVHLGEAKFEFVDYVIPLLPIAFEALRPSVKEEANNQNISNNDASNAATADNAIDFTAQRALQTEVIKEFRYMIAVVSITAVMSYGGDAADKDMLRVLEVVATASRHPTWQVRHAAVNFLRCFSSAHRFLFQTVHIDHTMAIVADLLADDRREVSSAAMAALTGILAAADTLDVAHEVDKYAVMAKRSKMKRPRKRDAAAADNNRIGNSNSGTASDIEKEARRARNQQISVFFLCAAVMAQPYDTPSYVPTALAAISKHSFERNAPLTVRDTVKKCCAEYKKTHMSDNWVQHRAAFSQEQLEALEDVVSSPHYYA